MTLCIVMSLSSPTTTMSLQLPSNDNVEFLIIIGYLRPFPSKPLHGCSCLQVKSVRFMSHVNLNNGILGLVGFTKLN